MTEMADTFLVPVQVATIFHVLLSIGCNRAVARGRRSMYRAFSIEFTNIQLGMIEPFWQHFVVGNAKSLLEDKKYR